MNKKTRVIRKWLVYGLLFTVLAVLQASVLPRLTLFGVHPNMLPVAAAMVSVLEGGVPGALFGVFVGLYCDALTPKVEAIHAIWFFISGLLIGLLVDALLKKTLATAVLCAVASLAVLDFLIFVLFFLIPRRAGMDAMAKVIVPEVFLSALLSPLVYGPLRLTHRRWKEKENGE